VIRREAESAGLSDAVVINTCAVTGEAVKQARQTIRRLRRERSDARIVVTGCAAQTAPQSFAAMPEVDRVLGNEEKISSAAWANIDANERIAVGDIMAVTNAALHRVDGIDGRARALLQVQNGCDHAAAYSAGKLRSVSVSTMWRTGGW
jgi:threonylcarbamoyladenosine tRNA methylthiotransferase MtaB